ncbi:hypothetical protein ACVOMV_36580 [Mesorhizobium atlanticum]
MTINAYRLGAGRRLVVGVLGAGLFHRLGSTAAADPQGWFKACTKQEDVDILQRAEHRHRRQLASSSRASA